MESFKSPDYPNAPLIEVALSAQFLPLNGFTSAHAGQFWAKVRSEFPLAQEHPPLPVVTELFGANRQTGGIEFGINFGFPGNRMWFMSNDGGQLIQVQNNRFVFNWRKTRPEESYPRYDETVRPKFIEYFRIFRETVSDLGLGSVAIDLFEAHYINQWTLEDGKSFGEVVGGWLKLFPDPVSGIKLEQAMISSQYQVDGPHGQPVGRLHINVAPHTNALGSSGVNLELICRTIPARMGEKPEFAPLDLAREKIVTTFEQITSDSAQKLWRGGS